MNIELENIGKQFNREWIIRAISLSFSSGEKVHLRGHNGSGKSTLLKIIAGLHLPSTGIVAWKDQNGEIYEEESRMKGYSICAPYVELFDHFSVSDTIDFHFEFKALLEGFTKDSVLDFCYLMDSKDKPVSALSSGMKQRLKLTLALLSKGDVLMLDEPCANLDAKAITWYQEALNQYLGDRLLLVCSNDKEEEHYLCNKTVNLENYK